jgi:hypothetical protein
VDVQWPLNILQRNLSVASRAAGQRKTGYDKKWPVSVCRIVDIYRDEVARMKATDSWNLSQEGKNRPRQPRLPNVRGRKPPTPDEDDEE